MTTAIAAVIGGLALLIWSAERFIEGAAALARHAGLPPLLIGMVIIGFGTSAPELAVSALSAIEGNPGLALGNAYGSNIANIALILGATALTGPIAIQSRLLRRELPILAMITLLALAQLLDGELSRLDATLLLIIFTALMSWSVREGMQHKRDALATEAGMEMRQTAMPLPTALFWLFVGLGVLIVSSRLLVWGAVEIALALDISDTVIGLTVVAVGTSLPELATCIIAARKHEHEMMLGNILGSNLFNTLAVTGLAGVIEPIGASPELIYRDGGLMLLLTLSLFLFGMTEKSVVRPPAGALLLTVYAAWMGWTVGTAIGFIPR